MHGSRLRTDSPSPERKSGHSVAVRRPKQGDRVEDPARELHLAVDADTGEIVASDLTARRTHDCPQVPGLLKQIGTPVASVSADGAYDTKAVYEAAYERGAVRVLIPPGRNAQLSPNPSTALKERNRNIRSIRRLGRRQWHTHSGYSKRSLVENTVFRYKTLIGRSMRSRTFDGQRVEV